jgi:hypothetical protein
MSKTFFKWLSAILVTTSFFLFIAGIWATPDYTQGRLLGTAFLFLVTSAFTWIGTEQL